MDLSAVFQALQLADQQAQKDSPYKPISDLSDALSSTIVSGAPKYNTSDNLIGGLITGLLGGFSNSLTDDYRTKQNSLAQNLLQDTLASDGATNTLVRPAGMSPSVFGSVENAGSLFKLSRELDAADEKRKAKEALDTALATKGAMIGPDGQMLAIPNAAKVLGDLHDAETRGNRAKADYDTADPEVKKSIDEAGGDPILGRQIFLKKQANESTLNGLSNVASVIKELKDLKTKALTVDTGILPDYVEGALNSIIASNNAGSSSATYNSAVIPKSDSLLRALTQAGRGSQYTQSQITKDLQLAWGKGPQALKDRIDNYIADLSIGGEQRAKDLVEGGYTRAAPILKHFQEINLPESAAAGAVTKTIGGRTYVKVPGGWKAE